MGKKCIGVDVGGTTVKLGLFEVTGELLKKWEIPTNREEQGKYIVSDIAESVRQVLDQENIPLTDVEGAGSATGIAREARRKMAACDTPSLMRKAGDQVTAKDVLDAAKEGDSLALEVMEVVGHYLGVALAGLALTVDPQMFVIGGGVSKAGQYLVEVINRHYAKYMTISENRGTIGLAKLGEDAGIYGAARIMLE